MKFLCANRIAPDDRVLRRHAVCLCPTKRAPGLNESNRIWCLSLLFHRRGLAVAWFSSNHSSFIYYFSSLFSVSRVTEENAVFAETPGMPPYTRTRLVGGSPQG